MSTTKNYQDRIIRKVSSLGRKGAVLITVISVVASLFIYLMLTSIFDTSITVFGFVASTVIPAMIAYPWMYFVLKITNLMLEKNKEIEMKNSLKNTLLSVVAHDVKGPLMNVDSLLNLYFLNEISQNELDDLLKDLQQQVKTNLDFVMNILLWTKTQFDGFQIIRTEVKLDELILRIIKAYNFQIQQKHILVETDADLTVTVDHDLMRLVMRNLLSNAIKFSEIGGTISINAKIENGLLVTSVTDQGLGIAQQKLNSLFDETNLSSSNGTNMETGTGLGLKLCNTFICALGGTIEAKSEPGKGSTFYFTIPQ